MTDDKIDNCLGYALRFWNLNKVYRIYYHPGHAINSPVAIPKTYWLPAEDYGYDYFSSSFAGLLTEFEQELLKIYFDNENSGTRN